MSKIEESAKAIGFFGSLRETISNIKTSLQDIEDRTKSAHRSLLQLVKGFKNHSIRIQKLENENTELKTKIILLENNYTHLNERLSEQLNLFDRHRNDNSLTKKTAPPIEGKITIHQDQ